MEFEWDEAKRLANIAKHDLDFELVAVVFAGPIWERQSSYLQEERWLATARWDDGWITVVFTWRNGRRRIISARSARTGERLGYCQIYP